MVKLISSCAGKVELASLSNTTRKFFKFPYCVENFGRTTWGSKPEWFGSIIINQFPHIVYANMGKLNNDCFDNHNNKIQYKTTNELQFGKI